MSKVKIAVVVQRYGLEVNGGSEIYCKTITERLAMYNDVEVLTTCALDYTTWENYYPQGISIVNNITVRRFKVDTQRNTKAFNKHNDKVFFEKHTYKDEVEWAYLQGPQSTGLLDFIKTNKSKYDVFFFMTYLYFTTYFGMQIVPEKSILIPTAHDEPSIHLDIFNPFFHLPRFICFLTEEEKAFVHKKFKNQYIMSEVLGYGLDILDYNVDEGFQKLNVPDNYVVYVGRIDESKGCRELIEFFLRYKTETYSDLKLVLVGKEVMEVPKNKDILCLGFVSEEYKFAVLKKAKALILSSKYESLSISVLESLSLGTPVLVNGYSEVLKGHCLRSNAGLYYRGYYEFAECLDVIVKNEGLNIRMGRNGIEYVRGNYTWDVVDGKLDGIVNGVAGIIS